MLAISKKTAYSSTAYMWWRVSTIGILGILAGSAIACLAFAYNYMFRTLDNTESVIQLTTEVPIMKVDIPQYQAALNIVNLKNEQVIFPSRLRNVFVYSSSTGEEATIIVAKVPTSTVEELESEGNIPSIESPAPAALPEQTDIRSSTQPAITPSSTESAGRPTSTEFLPSPSSTRPANTPNIGGSENAATSTYGE